MKHSSPSSAVTILLASLATTAAFAPLSDSSQQRHAIGRPSFSTLDVPDTASKMKVWPMHASNDDEMERSLNDDAGAVLSTFFATASISMAAMLAAGSTLPLLPANAIDVSPSFAQTMATTTTIAATKTGTNSQSPNLFEFLRKKNPEVVVFSTKERTIQTNSPSLAKFLNCKLIDEPGITGEGVNKVVNDSITLVLTNKLIFLTGTVLTIATMYSIAYQYYLSQINKKAKGKAKKA